MSDYLPLHSSKISFYFQSAGAPQQRVPWAFVLTVSLSLEGPGWGAFSPQLCGPHIIGNTTGWYYTLDLYIQIYTLSSLILSHDSWPNLLTTKIMWDEISYQYRAYQVPKIVWDEIYIGSYTLNDTCNHGTRQGLHVHYATLRVEQPRPKNLPFARNRT